MVFVCVCVCVCVCTCVFEGSIFIHCTLQHAKVLQLPTFWPQTCGLPCRLRQTVMQVTSTLSCCQQFATDNFNYKKFKMKTSFDLLTFPPCSKNPRLNTLAQKYVTELSAGWGQKMLIFTCHMVMMNKNKSQQKYWVYKVLAMTRMRCIWTGIWIITCHWGYKVLIIRIRCIWTFMWIITCHLGLESVSQLNLLGACVLAVTL